MSGAGAAATQSMVERMARILDAEQRTGHQDTAVDGGLSRWIARDLGDLPPDTAAAVRRLSQYSSLKPATRRRLIEAVLPLLTVEGAPAPRDSVADPVSVPDTALQPRKRNPAPKGSLADPITELWGIGATAAKRLRSLGISTVGDLLRHAPHRYIDHSATVSIADVKAGDDVTLVGSIVDVASRRAHTRRLSITEAALQDDTGQITAVWFNQPYLANTLSGRPNVALAGRVEYGRSGLQLTSPEYELDAAERLHAGRLVPVYPLTAGVTQRQLRRWVAAAVDSHAHVLEDPLPDVVRQRRELPSLGEAVVMMHRPDSAANAEAAMARLAFDELLVYQLAILTHRGRWRDSQPGRHIEFDRDAMAEFGARLPFTLTDDQRKALVDVLNDLRRDTPMSRLVQGDVGSGKTAVAAGALFAVCRAGWQGAMMAPTEVLAEQHTQTLAELLEPLGVRVARISGGIPVAAKRRLWREVAAGEIGVVVGTQALIQQSARFARLNLAVVDEQHRFGVQQRGEIRAKGYNPHLLAMTATPIPRTLALTFYGDLDITSIREMPSGRRPVRTAWVPKARRADAYAFLREQVEAGGQAFVICPLIQESESLQVRSAKDEFERLTTQVYPDLAHAIGLLHGRLSARAKDAVMRAFRDGEVKILVGTAVVEVGIDVPEATVIMIEGAERFGLSQLHQLRGRVGRGGQQSHCLLLSDTKDATENARLRILQSVHDGFELAERDLDLRGPGDILGTRQHGLTGFQFASVSDMEMIWRTREDAEAIIQADPELERPEHARLAVAVQSMLQESEWS